MGKFKYLSTLEKIVAVIGFSLFLVFNLIIALDYYNSCGILGFITIALVCVVSLYALWYIFICN